MTIVCTHTHTHTHTTHTHTHAHTHTHSHTSTCLREMEILQQLRRCLGETSGTMKQLAAIFNSCAYPHLLSGPIRSEFKDALTGVKDIADELTTLEQSGAPDSNQVSTRSLSPSFSLFLSPFAPLSPIFLSI